MKVSFVIPAYNAERTVRAAVESALGQTYPDVEVVVADDASTDATASVLYAMRDERVKVVHLDVNGGPGMARHAAMEAATGDIVACLDADDVAVPERLALQVPLLEDNASVVLVCGDFAASGDTSYRYRAPRNSGALAWSLHFRNPIATSSATFRRAAALSVGEVASRMRLAEDHALWTALACKGSFVATPRVVAVRRVAGGTLTSRYASEMEAASVAIGIEGIAALTGCTPSEDAYRLLRCGAGTGRAAEIVVDEAIEVWCTVFDAVQVGLASVADRNGAARESLNELRRLLRADPGRRYDIWRRTVGSRWVVMGPALASLSGLRVVRTMAEGR
ncbi:MAG: glycosyltransferase family 2 protein [Coriobacteriia bacterium]